MEYVADTLVDWIRQEEAKHQAALLAAEVERLLHEQKEPVEQPPAEEKETKKGGRKKSPKKGEGYDDKPIYDKLLMYFVIGTYGN